MSNRPTPKFKILLGFRSLYFKNIENLKILACTQKNLFKSRDFCGASPRISSRGTRLLPLVMSPMSAQIISKRCMQILICIGKLYHRFKQNVPESEPRQFDLLRLLAHCPRSRRFRLRLRTPALSTLRRLASQSPRYRTPPPPLAICHPSKEPRPHL